MLRGSSQAIKHIQYTPASKRFIANSHGAGPRARPRAAPTYSTVAATSAAAATVAVSLLYAHHQTVYSDAPRPAEKELAQAAAGRQSVEDDALGSFVWGSNRFVDD